MSIQERSPNVFRLRVFAGNDPIDGRQRFICETVRGSRRKATERHHEIELEVKRSERNRSSTTLRTTIETWRVQAEHAPSTAANYDRALATIPAKFLSTSIDKIRAATLNDLYARVVDKFGIARTRQVHAVISGALTYAWQQEWISANPARRVKPPAQPRRRATAPTKAQVRALLEAIVDRPEFHTFVMLSATTGARRSELLALHWSDIDLEAGQLSIDKALDPTGAGEKRTKTGDERILALGVETVAVLRRWRVAFLERALRIGATPAVDPYVFASDFTGSVAWRPDVATKRFIAVRDRLGLTCRLHDLRHYVATEMLAAGVPAKTAADRLGHKRTATTTDMYGHSIPATDRAAADMLDQGITG